MNFLSMIMNDLNADAVNQIRAGLARHLPGKVSGAHVAALLQVAAFIVQEGNGSPEDFKRAASVAWDQTAINTRGKA